jgi:hypothetical protein
MGSLYRSKHELVLLFKVGTASYVNNVELGRHGRNRTNVWDYGVNTFKANRLDEPEAGPNSGHRSSRDGRDAIAILSNSTSMLVSNRKFDCT